VRAKTRLPAINRLTGALPVPTDQRKALKAMAKNARWEPAAADQRKVYGNTRGGKKDFPSTSTGFKKREGDDRARTNDGPQNQPCVAVKTQLLKLKTMA
jgi:hypothetical protein